MKVLDLFSGLGGWSQAFKDRGHYVVTVDIEPSFNPTICADVMTLTPKDFKKYGQFDIILASPPCNRFSMARVWENWSKVTKRPKNKETLEAIDLIAHTLWLIMSLKPRWWILENPRGMLRRVLGKPQVTTYFASWQSSNERDDIIKAFHDKRKPVLKATDLWGVLPEGIKWEKPTSWAGDNKNGKIVRGRLRDSALRAKIPYGLSLAVCLACENELRDSSNNFR